MQPHPSIYLSLEAQEHIFFGQRCCFVITSVLNVLAMICLVKQTPDNQKVIRPYLIFIQVTVVASSVWLDIVLTPIPTFPAIAGYCVGLLCTAGVRPHSVLGIFVLIVVWAGSSIISCIFYRHQTIVPTSSRFRFSEAMRNAIQLIFVVFGSTNALAYTFYPFEKSDVIEILRESPYNLSWIMDRGAYFIHERNNHIVTAICIVDVNLILGVGLIWVLFWHMIHVLNAETNKSHQTLQRIRHSLLILFIQIAIPLIMMLLPAFILFTSLACECISFETTLSAYCVLAMHPFVHNVILLSITPAYRRFLLEKLLGKQTDTRVVTIHTSKGSGHK